MAAACRFWRTAQSFSRLHNQKLVFPKLLGTKRCFRAPGTPEEESFEEMFRNSEFVKMGRPQGKVVAGKVTHIVEHDDTTDLYVDFGWKFHAVCKRGTEQGRLYKVGDLVKLKLKALEATGHFLGQSRRLTVCEADAELQGKLNPDLTYKLLEKEPSSDAMQSTELDIDIFDVGSDVNSDKSINSRN